ncbi:MAG: type II toxin-antitoxin system RelE/ParE family toxin [Deltaproteobacteria bacterium]|nr:type II toxin-antitoxin system RelE/ParE family toxin [Deltaproteobacteria bacterium]
MFQIIASPRARKALKKLPERYRRRIIELLVIFRENPVPAEYYDIKKLKGHTDTYRARIGDTRVIYEIIWDSKKVHVLLIKRRERAYQ